MWVAVDGLRVRMPAPLISVRRDDNVTIPCRFSEYNENNTINVHWTQAQSGRSSEVHRFIPGQPQNSTRLYMADEREIRTGNAALHIPRAQLSDEGEYTCTVLVTPESREGSSVLQVSAAPTAVLTPGEAVHVELGSEKSVACEVRNFYPRDINIRWVRHEKASSDCKVLVEGTCTGDSTSNPDGTFNVTSHLTLLPAMEDSGYKYSCVVKHRSLPWDLMENFTLTVTEREDHSGTVIGAVIGTICAMLILFITSLVYNQVFKKGAPSLSAITGNDHLIDMTRTTLTCHIMNFKPKELEISACLKRRGEERETIHTWRSTDGGSVAIDVERQSLVNGTVSRTQRRLHLDMTAEITPSRSRLCGCIPWQGLSTYSCRCSLFITPSFSEDNGAEFSVHVSHAALRTAIYQTRMLQVSGVPPTLLNMVSPDRMTHGEKTTMTCAIIAFKPRTLHITWLKTDGNGRETEVATWNSNDGTEGTGDVHKVIENKNEDDSYSLQSALTMTPTLREDGDKYICRTFHPATGKRAEREQVMVVTAVPVLGPIKPEPGKVYVGKQMKLSCKIHSFYPMASLDVTWHSEGRSLDSEMGKILADPSGLYQVTSSMTYSPTVKDLRATFTCEVRHERSGALRSEAWTLQDLVSEPAVTEIRCSPSPTSEAVVTLSCHVRDLYPKEVDVRWYRGTSRMASDRSRVTLEEAAESGTCRGTLELDVMVETGCHEEFRMEMIHCRKTIERRFRLFLEGFPVLGEIVSEPREPTYGQSVTLRCKVTNANPQDLQVHWLKGGKRQETGQEKRVTEDGSLSCSLRITTTALDYRKAYTCCVQQRNNMTRPIKKDHYLLLPDKAPLISDITVRPERPVPEKEATFTVTISGFSPDIQVKWFQGFSQFPSDVVTTSEPQIGKDFLLRCSSSLRVTPQDHKASVRCEVTHSATKKVSERAYPLHLAGSTSDEPEECLSRPDSGHRLKTRGIECVPAAPRVGGEVSLTCYVDGCDAKYAAFSWNKGPFPIDSEIVNKTLEDGSGSLSTINFTAQEEDRDCTITCEVTYNLHTLEEHFTLKLK